MSISPNPPPALPASGSCTRPGELQTASMLPLLLSSTLLPSTSTSKLQYEHSWKLYGSDTAPHCLAPAWAQAEQLFRGHAASSCACVSATSPHSPWLQCGCSFLPIRTCTRDGQLLAVPALQLGGGEQRGEQRSSGNTDTVCTSPALMLTLLAGSPAYLLSGDEAGAGRSVGSMGAGKALQLCGLDSVALKAGCGLWVICCQCQRINC